MKPRKIILLITAIILVIACVVIPIVVLNNEDTVTITFETNGGYELDPIEVKKGERLDKEPITSKLGNIFDGWYIDEDLKERFYLNESFEEDTVLYASFIEGNEDVVIGGSTDVLLEDVSIDHIVTIITTIPITSKSLSTYLEFEVISGKSVNLIVTKIEGGYTISPETSYTTGGLYRFTLLDRDVSFKDQPSSIKALSIRIHKEATEVIDVIPDGYKTMKISDLASGLKEENGYLLPSDRYHLIIPKDIVEKNNFNVGDTIFLSDETGLPGPGSMFVNIENLSKQGDNYFVNTTDSSLEDVLDDVDVFFTNDVDLTSGTNNIDLDSVVDTLYESEGTKKLTALFAAAIISSPSVIKLGDGTPLYDPLEPLGFSDNAQKEHGVEIAIESFLEGLTITAFLGKASNSNFSNITPSEWSALEITFHYEATLKNKVNIDVEISLTQYLHATLQGNKEGSGLDIDFDFALNLYSQTDMSFTVLISITDGKEEDKNKDKDKDKDKENEIDISVEIGSIISGSAEEDEDNIVSKMKSLLDEKGDDYIELCNVELYKGSFPLIPKFPLFQFNARIAFVIKFVFAAGIQTDMSFLNAVQLGMVGNVKRAEVDMYRNELLGSNRFSLDIYACGYLGIKTGFSATLTLSLYSFLSYAGEIGVKIEVGVYIDIYGYVHFSLAKMQQYDDFLDMSIIGGIYIEIGLYFEFGLVANSIAFEFKKELGLLNIKIPITSFGDKWVLIGLESNTADYYMNSNRVNLNSLNLLKGKYLDITTGDTTERTISPSKLHVWFSNRYLLYDKNTGEIYVDKASIGKYRDELKPGDLTFEAVMTVVYSGQMLSFTNSPYSNLGLTSVGEVKITWVDPSLKIDDVTELKQMYTATVQYDCDGVKTVVATRKVQAGKSIGEFDTTEVYKTHRDTTGWDVNPNNAAISKDTTFTLYVEKIKVKVGFIWFDGEKWASEVWAVKLGDTPVIPENSENSYGSERVFTGWKGIKCLNSNQFAMAKTFNGIDAIPENIYGYGYIENLTLLGVDTTKPLKEASGSYDEAMEILTGDFFYQGVCYYAAQYECRQYPVTIEVMDVYNKPYIREYLLDYGDNANNYNVTNMSYRYEIVGWDFNNDGIADYTDSADFPIVTGPQTIKAIFTQRLVDVVIYDIYHKAHIEKGEAYQNNSLDTFEEINNPTRPSDSNIVLDHYEYSYDDKVYYPVYDNKLFLRDGMFIKPVYTFYSSIRIYTDKINSYKEANGTKFKPYSYVGLVEKASDGLNEYTQTGWEITTYSKYDGTNKKFVIGLYDEIIINDIVNLEHGMEFDYNIVPYYESTPTLYTVTVICENGIVPTYNDSIVVFENLEYWDMRDKIDYFIAHPAEKSIANDFVYEYGTAQNFTDSRTVIRIVYPIVSATKIQYTLTFKTESGSFSDNTTEKAFAQVTIKSSFPFSLVEIPTKLSVDRLYEFSNWVDSEGNKYTTDNEYNVLSNMTFTAEYKDIGPVMYTVEVITERSVFTNNEKKVILTGEYNSDIVLPDLPVAIDEGGYAYTAKDYDQKPDKFTSDMQVNVIWESTPRIFTISYFLDGIKYKETEYVPYGTKLTELPDPVDDENKSFTGWKWTSDISVYAVMPTTMPDANLYVNGEFVSYYVIYKEGDRVISKAVQKAGSEVTIINNYTEDGYSFTAWESTDIEKTDNKFIMPRSDVIFQTTRTINSYTITYLLDNENYHKETKKYLDNCTIIPEPSPITGHTFTGWKCTDVNIIDNKFIMPSKDIVFVGSYTKNEYIVTYKVDGNTFYVDTYKYQDVVTIRSDEEKEGYVFSGWILPSDIKVNDRKFVMDDRNITIESNFLIGEYNITIYLDNESVPSKTLKADYKDSVTLSIELANHLEVDKWESEDVVITNNEFTMPAKDISIKCITKYRTFKILYLESSTGSLVKEVPVKYLDTAYVDTLPCTRRGKVLSSWHYYTGLDAPLTTSSFIMPDNDVTFIGEWTPYFTIDDGTHYDKYDTDNPTVEGYTYDSYSKVLEIKSDDLTLSGTIENVLIFIDTNRVTLSNLTITSNEEGYYYLYYRDDFENYYRSEIDSCILINTIEGRCFDIFIEGIVEINKEDMDDGRIVAAISTINNQKMLYPEAPSIEDGHINIQGLGTDKSILRIRDTTYGIFSYLSLDIQKISLDIESKQLGIIGGETDLSNVNAKIKVLNNTGAAIVASSESGVNQYSLSINDSIIDITGSLESDNVFTFQGKTSGTIKTNGPCILSNGNIVFDLDTGYQIKFTKTTIDDSQSVIEKLYTAEIIFKNNNGFISDDSLSFERSTKQFHQLFDCLGILSIDGFTLVNEVTIG